MSKKTILYLSVYKAEDMVKFKSLDDVKYVLGVNYKGDIIKPPRCKVCGEYVIIDAYSGYAQCDDCGKIQKVYISNSINLRKGWDEYNGN